MTAKSQQYQDLEYGTGIYYRGQVDREWLIESSSIGIYVHINMMYPCCDDKGNTYYFKSIEAARQWIVDHHKEADMYDLN